MVREGQVKALSKPALNLALLTMSIGLRWTEVRVTAKYANNLDASSIAHSTKAKTAKLKHGNRRKLPFPTRFRKFDQGKTIKSIFQTRLSLSSQSVIGGSIITSGIINGCDYPKKKKEHFMAQQSTSTDQVIDANGRPYNRLLLVLTLLVGTFSTFIMQTILTTAFPTLMKHFNITADTVQWLTTGFMLVMGIMIPITA